MKKKIQLVSFDNPFPANYGGVIDVYYKIIALYEQGISIDLHLYGTRTAASHQELEKYCDAIYYYPRGSFFRGLFSSDPFRIATRKHKLLTQRLIATEAPVLFEGLQSCASIDKLKHHKVFVRAHNIEHTYFYKLAQSESNWLKKTLYYREAKKLKTFENKLAHAAGVFTIAPHEQRYFQSHYKNAHYIPAFHEANFNRDFKTPEKPFILYHGDLRIADNIKAAYFLIEVYKNTPHQLVIAGSAADEKLIKTIGQYPNIQHNPIPTQAALDTLLQSAHINTLLTFQHTGIKLKLLNTLYKGKHLICNTMMTADTGLTALTTTADTKAAFLSATEKLLSQPFHHEQQEARKKVLREFSPASSCKKMLAIVFPA